ncbi:hypothetical protein M3Y94_00001000 [Aphelenchoides besseyi]|nr:hypothetical protein M3Y94_00001000 [Aphelenchoides besseyi]
MIMDIKENRWGFLTIQYRRQVVFGSYLLTVVFAILSVRALKRQTTTLSHNAKKMLVDFTRTLYVKNIIPTLMIFLPLSVRYVAEYYKVESWAIDEFFNTGYSWLPLINSVVTLLLISHYRKVLIRRFKRFSSNSIQSTVFVSR